MSDGALGDRVLSLAWVEDPAERLDEVLSLCCELGETARAHLYLAAADVRRLHLERTRGTGAPAPPGDAEGGAAVALPLPAMELRAADSEHPRVVPTSEGSFYSLPLWRDSELLGTVRMGPLASGKLGRGVEKRLQAIAQPLAVVVSGAHGEDRLRRRAEEAETRIAVGRRLQGSALETGRFVTLLLRLAVRASGADGGFVAISGADGLVLRAAEGLAESLLSAIDLSDTGMIEIDSRTQAAFLADADAAARLGIRSLLAVPLISGERIEALLALVDTGGGRLDPASLRLLETLADQIRLMLANEQLFDEFIGHYLDTVRALAHALDARSTATEGHHERVAAVADAVAAEVGMSDADRDALRLAALIHDVGLAGVAATPDAYVADIEHPSIGAGMIESLPLARGVVEAVAGHHEWFDGWGFPAGIRGDQMHPLARVLALAEFVVEAGGGDAVQGPWEPRRLREELSDRNGSQFDPAMATAALRLLERGAMPDYAIGGDGWST
jgi:putative nucleotidyltransferase with HDIG domain